MRKFVTKHANFAKESIPRVIRAADGFSELKWRDIRSMTVVFCSLILTEEPCAITITMI